MNSIEELSQIMAECEQMKGLSVKDHGLKVWAKYEELHNHIVKGEPLTSTWKFPSWFEIYKQQLFADKIAGDASIMSEYLIWHDCGKPFCKTIDAEGKVHFPNHAQVSKEIWSKFATNPIVPELIGQDMDLHILKPEGIPEFAQRETAAALILATLCELHANAELFGGLESTGFKIKMKHLESRGKQICKIKYSKEN